MSRPVALGNTSSLKSSGLWDPVLKAGIAPVIVWQEPGQPDVPMAVTHSYGRGDVVYFNDFSAYFNSCWRGDKQYGTQLMQNAIDHVAGQSCPYCQKYSILIIGEPHLYFVQEIEDMGHSVSVVATNINIPDPLDLYDVIALVWGSGLSDDEWGRMDSFVVGGGGILIFENAIWTNHHDSTVMSLGMNPVANYGDNNPNYQQIRGTRKDPIAVAPFSSLVVGVADPADISGISYRSVLKPEAQVIMRWERPTSDPDPEDGGDPWEGAPMLATYAYGAGRVAYCTSEDIHDKGMLRNFEDARRLVRNMIDYVMAGKPSTACVDCDQDGLCDGDEIGFMTETDCDRNGTLDSCDISSGTHADENSDGVPDICEPTDLYTVAVRDRSGQTLFSVDPNAPEQPLVAYRGTEANHIAQTQYQYDPSGKITQIIVTPTDGSAAPRTVDVIYDPDNPERQIGTLLSSCGCGAARNQFVYRDDRNRITKITTAELPPQDATILEEFEYVGPTDDRLSVHRRRDSAEQLVEVERRYYYDNGDGSYLVVVCNPIDAIDAEVHSESYDVNGRLRNIFEYDSVKDRSVCDAPGIPAYTTTYSFARQESGGVVTGERRETIFPSGRKEVRLWILSDIPPPYQQDNEKTVQTYSVATDDPQEANKINLKTEIWKYHDGLGDYRLANVIEPSGATTTYAYDDAPGGNPDLVVTETRSGDTGLWETQQSITRFIYDPLGSGRVDQEIRTSPKNGTGNESCGSAGDTGCVATKFEYDQFGRLTKRIENFGATAPETRTTKYVYNAFDEQIFVGQELDDGPTYLVRANVYNSYGQLEHEYSCQHTAASFSDPANPPVSILEQTTYEYHPLSGRTTKERVRVVDTIPFAFDLDPAPADTADKVNNYDATGVWLLSVDEPCNVSQGPCLIRTTFMYNDQGRVVRTTSPENVVNKSVFDGRGLVKDAVVEGASVQPITTTTHYTPDGQVDSVDHPNGTYTVLQYDSFGRLWVQKRCAIADCDNPIDVATTFEYDDAGNVTRQYTEGVSDTVTSYDTFGRPYRVRRRAIVGVDGAQVDHITLTKYNAAGVVEAIAGKFDSNANIIIDYTDSVTKFDYSDLGEVVETKRLNRTPVGGVLTQREEIAKSSYDPAGRQKQQVVCLDANCTGNSALTTDFEHDALGRVIKTIDPEGHYVEQVYDSRGQLIRRKSYEEPNSATGERDGTGGVVRRQERWSYDVTGRLTQTARMAVASSAPTTAPNAGVDRVVEFTYDRDGRRLTMKTYNMNDGLTALTTTTEYDGIGRLKKTIDPLGNYEENVYEAGTGLLDYRNIADGLDGGLSPILS